ncbi:MAG: hypothetical protein U0Q55_04390 [Vicinamibacterales bacterium]
MVRVLILVFDITGGKNRKEAWKAGDPIVLASSKFELVTSTSSHKEPFVVLAHTRDSVPPDSPDLAQRLERFEASLKLRDEIPVGLLYFSGDKGGASHLSGIRTPERPNVRRYICQMTVDDTNANVFANNLRRVVEDWETALNDGHKDAIPLWDALWHDSAEVVAEWLCAVGFGLKCSSLDSGSELGLRKAIKDRFLLGEALNDAFERWRKGEGPVETERLAKSLAHLEGNRSVARADAAARLLGERSRVSHDLFKNQFGALLQPGWDSEGTDRLGPRDVVVCAINGDPEARQSVEEAVRVWGEVVWPALDDFLRSVERSLGFIATERFKREHSDLEPSSAAILSVLQPHQSQTAKDAAAAFWTACDRADAILSGLATRPDDYLEGWVSTAEGNRHPRR